MKIATIAATAVLIAMPALALGQGQQQKGTAQAQKGAQAQAVPRTVHSEMMLYKGLNYNDEAFTVEDPSSLTRTEWNIRSIAVHPGDRWQICARPRFRDPCIILDRSVPDASMIGVNGQIGSARLATRVQGQGN